MSELSFFKSLTLPKSFWPWKKEAESVLGVDFGSSSIKMVQLRRFKERAILETYGELATGPYGGVEVGRAAKIDDAKAKEAISDLIKEAGIKSKDAVINVPMHSSFVTVIDMPLMSERELGEAIKFEARRYVPVPIADVTLDWWIIPEGFSANPSANDNEGLVKKKKFMSVLLVAIHKEILDKYRSILKSAGLQVLAFEIEIFSAARSILASDLAPVLLIDAGAASAKITAVDYGIVRMVYAYERGSQEISETLARSLNVNFARAEELKRVIGLSDKPEHQEIKSIIEPLVDRLFSEAGRRFWITGANQVDPSAG
ncbi:MAG: pilus assembly protein PilM [Patescibacteria group bacterium]